MTFFDILPPHIFITFLIIIAIGCFWGFKGPAKYRRNRFYPMKGAHLNQKSNEGFPAGRVFDEGMSRVGNPDVPVRLLKSGNRKSILNTICPK